MDFGSEVPGSSNVAALETATNAGRHASSTNADRDENGANTSGNSTHLLTPPDRIVVTHGVMKVLKPSFRRRLITNGNNAGLRVRYLSERHSLVFCFENSETALVFEL